MKHIHNTMKRVLAATLSVLTVASPIGANVGVFLTEGAKLVASAGDNIEQQQTTTQIKATDLIADYNSGTLAYMGRILNPNDSITDDSNEYDLYLAVDENEYNNIPDDPSVAFSPIKKMEIKGYRVTGKKLVVWLEEAKNAHLIGSIKPGTVFEAGDVIKNPTDGQGKPVGGQFVICQNADAFNAFIEYYAKSGTEVTDVQGDTITIANSAFFDQFAQVGDPFEADRTVDAIPGTIFKECKEVVVSDGGTGGTNVVGHVLILADPDKTVLQNHDIEVRVTTEDIRRAIYAGMDTNGKTYYRSEKVQDEIKYYPVSEDELNSMHFKYGVTNNPSETTLDASAARFIGIAQAEGTENFKLIEKANDINGHGVGAAISGTGNDADYKTGSAKKCELQPGNYMMVFNVPYGENLDRNTYMLYPFTVMEEVVPDPEPASLSDILGVEFEGAIKDETTVTPTVASIPLGTDPGAKLMKAPATEADEPTEVQGTQLTYYKKAVGETQWTILGAGEAGNLDQLGMGSYKVVATFTLSEVFDTLDKAKEFFPEATDLAEEGTFTAYFDVVKGEIADKDKYEVRQENFTYGTESAPTPELWFFGEVDNENDDEKVTTPDNQRNIGSVEVQYLPNYTAGDPNKFDGDLTILINKNAPTNASKYNWVRMEVKPVDGDKYNSFFTPWVQYTIEKAELTRPDDDGVENPDITAEPTLYDPEKDANAVNNKYRAYEFLDVDQPVFKTPATVATPAKTGVKYTVITGEEFERVVKTAAEIADANPKGLVPFITDTYAELKTHMTETSTDVTVKDVGEYRAVWFYDGDENHFGAPALDDAIADYYAAKEAYEQALLSSQQEGSGQEGSGQAPNQIQLNGSSLPSLKNSEQSNEDLKSKAAEAEKQFEEAANNVFVKFIEFVGKNTASLEVKYATVPLSLVGLDDDAEQAPAVLTTMVTNEADDSNVETVVEKVENTLPVTGNNTYKLYTNKSLNADQNYTALVDAANIGTNVEFNGKTYNYCYTLRIPAIPKNGYMLSHDTGWAGRVKTNNTAVLEVDDNNKFEHAVDVAEINKDIEYYYGDKPDIKDVIVNEGYDKVVKINRVYFTDLTNTVEVETPVAGQKYNATAEVYIDPTGKGNFEESNANVVYLRKEVEYKQRPLSLCDAYQVIDGEEVLISPETNKLQDTVYNRKEQSVQIVFRNPAITDEANPKGVVLATTDYELSTDWATAKDADTYTLTYKGMNPNYAAEERVFTWTITPADLQITATPKDNIVYDGKALDDTDFTYTGDDCDLISTEGTFVGVTSNVEGGDITNAGKTTAKITITNSNYNPLVLPVETVINRRSVTLTPAANQYQVYGSKVSPEIEYTIEAMNATDKTGVVENGENVLRGKIRVGAEIATTNVQKNGTTDRYDYVTYVNDAGTYAYVLDGLDNVTNYAVTIADGYSFTVLPKTLTADMFTINEGYDEFYYNSQDQGPHKEYVADDGKFLLSTDRDMLTASDYKQYGTEEACLPGTYYLEFTGQNNYTGYVRKAWTINSTSQESSVHAESFTYNGKSIEENKKLTIDEVAIQGAKQTITYYGGYDGEAELNEALLSKLTKLNAAPTDAGNYVVVVKTTATGAVFEDQYAAFTIAQRPITVVPKTTEGYYSDEFDLSYDVVYNFNADAETGVLEGEDAEITGTLGIEDPDGDVGKRKFTTGGLKISNPNYIAVVEDTFEIKPKQIKNSDLKVVSEAIINNNGVAVVEDAVKVVVNGRELTKYNPETGKGDYRVVSATTTSKEEAFSIQIRGTNNYATNLASTTVEVASSKSRITGYAVIDNQNRIGFTADTTYTGNVKNAKAGVEVRRPKSDGTVEFNDLELPVGVSTFKVRDLGYGAEAKLYVEVNNVRVYGETVTVAAADLKNDTTYVPIAVNNAVKYDNQNRVAFTVISGKDNNVTACGVEVYRNGANAEPTNVLELPVGASSFRVKDLGKGITIKPFTVDKNGKKTYGATYTTSYAAVTSPKA